MNFLSAYQPLRRSHSDKKGARIYTKGASEDDRRALIMAHILHLNNRRQVLDRVGRGLLKLNGVPDQWHSDPDIVTAALLSNGNNLRHASWVFRDDEKFVLMAVDSKTSAIRHASDRLLNDRTFMLSVMKEHGFALQYAPTSFVYDPDVALVAVTDCAEAVQFLPDTLLEDRAFVLKCVASNGRALAYLPTVYRNDTEVVMTAVASPTYVFPHASAALRDDRDLAP